jgi:hypothetical protein
MFQSLHVSHGGNVFEINGNTVAGALPTNADDREAWAGQVLLVSPNVLRGQGNILHVESLIDSGKASGDIDDFVIDNSLSSTRPPGLAAILSEASSRQSDNSHEPNG